MKISKFFLFFPVLLSAQQPVEIKQFTPTIISISVGPYGLDKERCNFWLNSPGAGQVQIACYLPNNPIPIKNEILVPGKSVGSWVFDDASITWEFKPGEFHLTGAVAPGGNEAKLDGTF